MILSLHRMDAEIQDFAYGEDDNGRLIGGKLADDVQSIYGKLYEEMPGCWLRFTSTAWGAR